MTRKLTEKDRRQKQEASRTHGIYAYRDRGEEALSAENVRSLHDLRELVRSEPGRVALRQELAARVAMIVYMGFSELQKEHDAGRNIFNSPVVKRASTWFAELRRILDSFPPEGDVIDVQTVMQAMEEYDNQED